MKTQKVIRACYYDDHDLVDILELPVSDPRWPRAVRREIFEGAYRQCNAIRVEYSCALCYVL